MKGNQVISVFVPGKPATKGSYRHIGRGRMINDNPRGKKWQKTATTIAANEWRGGPTGGPVSVDVYIYLARPKRHYGSRNKQPYLRDDAPIACASLPDADKVARLALDSLTGVVYVDDKQVDELRVEKHWAPDKNKEPGVLIVARG